MTTKPKGRRGRRAAIAGAAAWLTSALLLVPIDALAEVVAAEPLSPIAAPYPAEGDGREVQVVLQIVLDQAGRVESVVETSRVPADAPAAFAEAAIAAAEGATFRPSSRDGKAIRSRIEYVVVFRAPLSASPGSGVEPIEEPGAAASAAERELSEISVVARSPPPARGLGDLLIDRDRLDAAPHRAGTELLSAAPSVFVDHEDSEGIANDIHLRGFDAEHGSEIELYAGPVPLNTPMHLAGSGYADPTFIIPEVVRSVRVSAGVYDPRQGDGAIAGSAAFELGAPERGFRLAATYGSFHQSRWLAVAAPSGEDEATFLAASFRDTDGFGPGNRAGSSAAALGQYAFELGGFRATFSLAAYGGRSRLPGFVREDDHRAGRIGFDDSYAGASAAIASASRAHVAMALDRDLAGGAKVGLAAWTAVSGLLSRQNLTGSLRADPADPGSFPGDLLETANDERAFGARASFATRTFALASFAKVRAEPGVSVRAGLQDQARSFVDPASALPFERRTDGRVTSSDLGAYVDLEVRLFGKWRLSGGPRAEALATQVVDRLHDGTGGAGEARRTTFGAALFPRASIELEVLPWLSPVASYGEGFRSRDPWTLRDGDDRPFSRVRSFELGARARVDGERWRMSAAYFESRVEDELVLDAEDGALETQGASVRRGLAAWVAAAPRPWMNALASLTYNHARYAGAADARFVPEVPAILLHLDAGAKLELGRLAGRTVEGRAGAGVTYIAGRHATDEIVSPPVFVLNARASLRVGALELGVESFNLLDRRYADDEIVFTSSWGRAPGPAGAASGLHFSAAAPRTVLGTLTLRFGA